MTTRLALASIQETNVSSDTICNIGAINTVKVNITGTNTILSFGTAAHRWRLIRFASTATLIHNDASLKLPNNKESIRTASGDTATATSDASGIWTIRDYTRASGFEPEIFDARRFGVSAKDDADPEDNNDALVTAIGEASAVAGMVQLPRGRIRFDGDPMALTNGITINGRGAALNWDELGNITVPVYPTKLQWMGSSGSMFLIDNDVEDAGFSNLTLDGGVALGDLGTSTVYGVTVKGGKRPHFNNVSFQNLATGLRLEGDETLPASLGPITPIAGANVIALGHMLWTGVPLDAPLALHIRVRATRASNHAVWAEGLVFAFDRTTGEFTIDVDTVASGAAGAGPFTDWTLTQYLQKYNGWGVFRDTYYGRVGRAVHFNPVNKGGVTNHQFYNTFVDGYTEVALDLVAHADDNRFYGAYIGAPAPNSTAIIHGSKDPDTFEGVYQNDMWGIGVDLGATWEDYPACLLLPEDERITDGIRSIVVNDTGTYTTIAEGYIGQEGPRYTPIYIRPGSNFDWRDGNATWVRYARKIISRASKAAEAGFNLPSGTWPDAPVDGDMAIVSTGLKFQYGGSPYVTATLEGTQTFSGVKTFSEKLIVTYAPLVPPYIGIALYSGLSTNYTAIGIGRTPGTIDGYFAVAGAAGQYLPLTVQGDVTLQAVNKLHLGTGGVGTGVEGVTISGTDVTAYLPLITKASAAGGAGLIVTQGVEPTSPTDGMIWNDGTNMKFRASGVTYTIVTGFGAGPILSVPGGGTGVGTLTGIVKGNGTAPFTAVAAPSGAIVGTTDSQTLSNKMLTAPQVTGNITLTAASGSVPFVLMTNSDYVGGSAGSGIVVTTGAASGATYASLYGFTAGNTAYGSIVVTGKFGINVVPSSYDLDVAGTARIGGNTGVGVAPLTRLHIGAASGVLPTLFLTNYDFVSGSVGSGVVLTTGAVSGNTYGSLYAVTSGSTAFGNLLISGKVGFGALPGAYDVDITGTVRITGAPTVASLINTGTLTLPTSTDTLVGRSTTDTLINKGINAANNTITNLTTSAFAPNVADTDPTLAANSNTRFATQAAVKAYADALIAANDAMVFKGVIDCSANPNYPAADRGWTYKVSVAGKIGGASGLNVEVGDTLLCITDGTASGTQAAVGANWNIVQANLDGAVIGPASVTDDLPAIFDGATGKLIKSKTYAAFKTLLVLAKGDVGLGSVDNTADTAKPVSTAQLTALNLKADLASPQFTGTVVLTATSGNVPFFLMTNSDYVGGSVGSGLVVTTGAVSGNTYTSLYSFTAGNTAFGSILITGKVGFGVVPSTFDYDFAGTVHASGKVTLAASTTGAASVNLPAGVDPTSPGAGDVWNDSHRPRTNDGLATGSILRTLYVGANGSTNDSASGSGAYITHDLNFVLPANFLIANRALRVTAAFRTTVGSGPPTLDIRLLAGSTEIAHHRPQQTASLSDRTQAMCWIIQGEAAPSAAANVEVAMTGNSGNLSSGQFNSDTVMPVALATNGTLTLQIATQWATAGTGTNTIKLSQLIIEALN